MKNNKTSKLGFLSLVCFVCTFIILGNFGTDSAINNFFLMCVLFCLLVLSLILSIVGLTSGRQNKVNNVFSVATLVMVVGIFVLGVV